MKNFISTECETKLKYHNMLTTCRQRKPYHKHWQSSGWTRLRNKSYRPSAPGPPRHGLFVLVHTASPLSLTCHCLPYRRPPTHPSPPTYSITGAVYNHEKVWEKPFPSSGQKALGWGKERIRHEVGRTASCSPQSLEIIPQIQYIKVFPVLERTEKIGRQILLATLNKYNLDSETLKEMTPKSKN